MEAQRVRLLISVANVEDAQAALEGGADIVDAKDPFAGALGAVSPITLRGIVGAVGGARPVSVALGDVSDERAVELAARRAASERVAYVKIGFAGVDDEALVERLIAAAADGASMVSSAVGVIAVAYADYERVGAVSPLGVVVAAERAGAMGVLLDTAVKHAGNLFAMWRATDVATWVRGAHDAALTAAVAGSLGSRDLAAVRVIGADVAGVRGAACEGGRLGRVTRDRVAALALSAGQRVWPGEEIAQRRAAAREGGAFRPGFDRNGDGELRPSAVLP